MSLFRILLLLVPAAMAQNPLVTAADPFLGKFQNEQLQLEMARSGAEYSGVILLGGQRLPVKAKAAAGKLGGTFMAGGQNYAFQAVRNGSKLTLTTDGVTYVLEKAATVSAAPETAAPAAPAAPATPVPAVVGEWQSKNGLVKLKADGTATIGEKSHRWSVQGNFITFTGNGESVQVPFDMAGDTWTWKFPDGQMVWNRVKPSEGIAGSWQGPSGNVQINLDGTAMVSGVPYRYTQAGDRLTLMGPDGTFVATVQQSGDGMTWVVNGKTLTFQRAANVWAVGGGTGTEGVLPELIGKWCQAADCFTFLTDGSFLHANESSDSGTWAATNDSITTRSKKTGVRTFRLEKRNHAKTGDPMLVLDGTEYATALPRAPWR